MAKKTPLRRSRAKPLPAIQPSAGVRSSYEEALQRLIDEMQRSVIYHLSAAYRRNEPVMAMDALPAQALQKALDQLRARWTGRFDDLAVKLARYFARSQARRSDEAMARMLKKAGWTVDFKMTRAQRDALAAIVNENVSLIKSLPEQCLTQVQGSVMRSVAAGYDVKILADDLRTHFGVSRKRAKFIAYEQTKQTNAMLTRVRQVELGIQECLWKHSHGGRVPRPNHVRFGKEKALYDPAKGMWDPDADGPGRGRWILPGQLIRCRCMGRPILPELNRRYEAA